MITVSNQIECVIFDFGNVIANFEHMDACDALARLSPKGWDGTRIYAEIFKEGGLENDYDSGKKTTRKFLDALREKFGIDADDQTIESAWGNIFRPNERIIELIPKLHSMAYRLVLASNTNDIHYRWFKRQFPVLEFFDETVLSFEIGHRKPEREFFQE